MYKNLCQVMNKIGINEGQITSDLGLNSKFINGEHELSFSDAQKIQKKYFKEYSITYLFDKQKRS